MRKRRGVSCFVGERGGVGLGGWGGRPLRSTHRGEVGGKTFVGEGGKE